MIERRSVWFVAWFVVAAAYVVGLLGILTIGIFVLPVAVVMTLFLVTRRHASDGLAGAISGLGLPLLYVAYLNRDGPGTICTTHSGGGVSCTEEWSPWPWLAVGIALFVLGGAIFSMSGRRRQSRA